MSELDNIKIEIIIQFLLLLPLLLKKHGITVSLALLAVFEISTKLFSSLSYSNIISSIVIAILFILLKKSKIESVIYMLITGFLLKSNIIYESFIILIFIYIIDVYFNKKNLLKSSLQIYFILFSLYMLKLTNSLVDINEYSSSIYFFLILFYVSINDEKVNEEYGLDIIKYVIFPFTIVNELSLSNINSDWVIIIVSTFLLFEFIKVFLGAQETLVTFRINLYAGIGYLMITENNNYLSIFVLSLLHLIVSNYKGNFLKKSRKLCVLKITPYNFFFISSVFIMDLKTPEVIGLKVILFFVILISYILLEKQEKLILDKTA